MKNETIYLKVDDRNRISLNKVSKDLSAIYKARMQGNKIILEPVLEVPEDEAWLFLPENKEILARIKKSLTQEATIDLGSFKKHLKSK
jgi:DNA replication initiation complex subunit (GINS family)